jgi:hypothetical protein
MKSTIINVALGMRGNRLLCRVDITGVKIVSGANLEGVAVLDVAIADTKQRNG